MDNTLTTCNQHTNDYTKLKTSKRQLGSRVWLLIAKNCGKECIEVDT